MQVSPFFALVLLQIELNTLKLQSIKNNTFVTKINISVFSVLGAVTNFSLIAACSLSTPKLYSWYLCHILEMVLQFLHPKYYMQQKCSPCTHLKPFSIYLLHLKRDCVGHLRRYELEKLQCFRESSQVSFR